VKKLAQFECGVILLFHTIHRAGSAPSPIALVDRFVNVPVTSSPSTLWLLELSRKRTFRDFDRATRCRMGRKGGALTARRSVVSSCSCACSISDVPFPLRSVRSICAASAASFPSSSLFLYSGLAYCFLSQMCEIHVDPASSCRSGDAWKGGALKSSASVQDGFSVLRRRHPS